jgi:hypothetical protein
MRVHVHDLDGTAADQDLLARVLRGAVERAAEQQSTGSRADGGMQKIPATRPRCCATRRHGRSTFYQ